MTITTADVGGNLGKEKHQENLTAPAIENVNPVTVQVFLSY